MQLCVSECVRLRGCVGPGQAVSVDLCLRASVYVRVSISV